MRRNKRNGQPDEGVCDVQHTVHSRMNYLLLGNTKETVSKIQGVCDIRHAVHSDELFVLIQENRNGSNEQDVSDTRQTCV